MVIISLSLLSKIKSNPIYSISHWLNWTIDSWSLNHSNNFWVGVEIRIPQLRSESSAIIIFCKASRESDFPKI